MSWLVAISCSGKERVARQDLQDRGFECYVPRYRQRAIVNRRVSFVERNLFGRYFFVTLNDDWPSIYYSDHVFGLLMNDGKPSDIADEVVDEIRSREDHRGFVKVEELYRKKFYRGQCVRVTSGKLIGLIGTFGGDHDDYRDRARVLFDMMGRKAVVIIRQDDLAIEDKAKRRRKRYQHTSIVA